MLSDDKGGIKMNHSIKVILATIIGVGLVLAGCGGNTPDMVSTRGEGTIPIGKISMKPVTPVQVVATYQYGQSYPGTVTSDGTIYMQALPYGEMSLAVTPTESCYAPATYSVDVKAQQRYIINVAVQKVDPAVTVDSLAIEIPNAKAMQVGKTYPIKVTVSGKNAANLKPTVWVNGGAGSIDSGNRFLAQVSGDASIHAKIGDVEASIPITIY